MIDKTKLYSITLTLPLIAVVLSQFVITNNFTAQVNVLAASVSFASILAIFSVWDKGMNAVLFAAFFGLSIRALIIAYLIKNGFTKDERILACGFVIGYHFVETIVVALVFSKTKISTIQEQKVNA